MATTTIGVPRERKDDEARVAITPDGVRELRAASVDVIIETGAGVGSGISDDDFIAAGAEVTDDVAELWASSQIVCKVKEPVESEFGHLRSGLMLFTYLHLAAYPAVAEALMASGVTAIAYETVQRPSGALPLLAPMSEIAGRMSIQHGAHLLEGHSGGRGVLLGGAPGVQPAKVVVVGAGNVGWNAARMAAGLEAEVALLDKDIERLRSLDRFSSRRITTLASNRGQLERVIAEADLVIGAVLVPGGRAPVVVSEDMVRSMAAGSVVIDVAIDQGGCIETSHETSHHDPVFVLHGVLHSAVSNMPGAVPRTSTYALTNVTLPYMEALGTLGLAGALERHPELRSGVNVQRGAVTNEAVALSLGLSASGLDLGV